MRARLREVEMDEQRCLSNLGLNRKWMKESKRDFSPLVNGNEGRDYILHPNLTPIPVPPYPTFIYNI